MATVLYIVKIIDIAYFLGQAIYVYSKGIAAAWKSFAMQW